MEQKKLLAEKIVKAVMEVTDSKERSITVAFEDVPVEEWRDRVYIPDIEGKKELLVKHPGYFYDESGNVRR